MEAERRIHEVLIVIKIVTIPSQAIIPHQIDEPDCSSIQGLEVYSVVGGCEHQGWCAKMFLEELWSRFAQLPGNSQLQG